MRPVMLIVDDDLNFLSDFKLLLDQYFDCITAGDYDNGINLFFEKNPDVVLLDLMLGNKSGIDLLKQIKSEDENIPVIMITDYASPQSAIDAIKLGALDYISKTPDLARLKAVISKSLDQRLLNLHSKSIEQEINNPFATIIGNSEAIVSLKEQIELYAGNDLTVLITGESGVGKELVARQIHSKSNRSSKPFIAVNCAAIPKDLLESELFGHEKGAFTGAVKKKLGKFEIATDGTIFLDEISELDSSAQVKLLRVLQEKEFDRVGGTFTIKTNTRIIAASNRELKKEVESLKFREDLFYRLEVLPIHVPPLRERKADIPALAEYFLQQALIELKKSKMKFNPEAINKLTQYNFPGNIRELKNCILQSVLTAKELEITSQDIRILINHEDDLEIPVPQTWDELDAMRKKAVDEAARKVEKVFLDNLLKKFDGNITKAAEHIGINRTNLHKMMKKVNEG